MAEVPGPDALRATLPASDESAPVVRPVLSGYDLGALIGRGGMGEVTAAHDAKIGRQVAIKRMRGVSTSAATSERFLREAKIQARLEHPAIIPVHDLGIDDSGQPYFTMKRLSGKTLAELLPNHPSRQRLLRAFADVCSAVAFAHEHGVVHCDLKPANIMLGDFNEVYVIDWGLALVMHGGDVGLGLNTLDRETRAGELIGTPGYMAPEQVRAADEIGPPADIYALGTILFELLANGALHPSGVAGLASTLELADGSPAARNPGGSVPPELDALCAVALRREPSERPTAREMAERVEHYLDGDRDHEQRRQLAATWLASAQRALRSDDVGGRAEAMRFAGRALALDPESGSAAELVTRLMLEPPRRLPLALQQELAATEAATQRRQSKIATASFAAVAVFLVLACVGGVRSLSVFIAIAALTLLLAGMAFRFSRRVATRSQMLFLALGNVTLAAFLSRAFGSLILAPAVTCVMAVSLTSYPQLIARARLVVAMLVASWLTPLLLEQLGVLESTWRIEGGQVISSSHLMVLGSSSPILLVAFNVLTIVVIAWFSSALARSRRDAQHEVEIQAWHLRQLLPKAPS